MATKRKTAKRKPATRKSTTKRKTTTAKRKTTTTKRKVAAKGRKTTAKKRKPAKRKTNTSAIRSTFTKTQLMSHIAEHCENQGVELTRKEVNAVFEGLAETVARSIKKGGAGSIKIPGLMKIYTVHKKATKARKGTNPFTGEPCIFKAKPARTMVKARALKALKDDVQ